MKKKPNGLPAPNYTPMPNELIKLFRDMKEAEMRVTVTIARETFGWHKGKAKLTTPELEEKTGMSAHGVVTGIKHGMVRGTIGRESYGRTFRYFLIVKPENGAESEPPSKMGDDAELTPIQNGVRTPSKMGVNPILDGGISLLEKENNKERKENRPPHTHNMLNGATEKDAVCVCVSRFSLEECLSYARAQKGVTNPEGLARSIYKTGEADELIKIWKDQSAAPVDPSVCPDCNGRGMIYIDPTDMSRGVRKCKHPQLVGATA